MMIPNILGPGSKGLDKMLQAHSSYDSRLPIAYTKGAKSIGGHDADAYRPPHDSATGTASFVLKLQERTAAKGRELKPWWQVEMPSRQYLVEPNIWELKS